ncbi:MAG: 3-mercaptopyruvate sulfurtransferase [Pseudorhodobacter sp.]|nr:3-mercaptopyruvate sulfurtransferase [Pseudorhodobacter sp.]
MPDDPTTLVSTAWLAEHLSDPDLRVLDASWYLPAQNRDARADYAAGHIQGARFFDIDEIADLTVDLPHMAPPPEKFASRLRVMGVGDGSQVVVYDGMGLFSAARVWWTFRLMGLTRIAVLDGGLPKWVAEGRPLTTALPEPARPHLTPHLQPDLVKTADQVLQSLQTGSAQLVDARAAARFKGQAPEPRAGLRSGHMPGAYNVPYTTMLNPDGTMKSAKDLRATFTAAGIDLARPIITTCGSGVTAAVLSLALARIGHTDHALYDGSWSEWGGRPDLPVAKD